MNTENNNVEKIIRNINLKNLLQSKLNIREERYSTAIKFLDGLVYKLNATNKADKNKIFNIKNGRIIVFKYFSDNALFLVSEKQVWKKLKIEDDDKKYLIKKYIVNNLAFLDNKYKKIDINIKIDHIYAY